MCNINATYFLSNKRRIQLNKELNIEALVLDAINQLYNDRAVDDDTKKQLLNAHYQPLKEAVNEGYKTKVEYGTPNYEFLKQLQTNTAVYAAFKNHSAIKEMVTALKDKEGNLRSREDFKTEALKIDGNYRNNRLDVEYDNAVRQARMAANWQRYQKNKRLYPNLRYVMSKAANPDPKHLQYVGITLPIDNPFWNTNYPPNRWGCQCGVEPTDADTTDIPNNLPPVPNDFAFNSGKMGKIFDIENSEYIKSATPKEQPKLIKQAKALVNIEEAKNAPYTTIYKSKAGTEVTAHPLSYEAADFNSNLKYVRDLANSKVVVNNIQILPNLNAYPQLRETLLPDGKGATHPDYRIDGKLIDAKEPQLAKAGANTVRNRLRDAHAQANGILLIIEKDFITQDKLYREFNSKLQYNAYKNFTIYLKYGSTWQRFERDEFLTMYKALKKP